jgi:hypothetical protein
MINLSNQRSTELLYHDSALRHEFKVWRMQSDGPTKPFAKHRSQIERVTNLLEAHLETIDAANVTVAYEPQETAYSHLLGVYRIWSYFRSKFIMRADNRLGDMLRCADELAWACYKPAREKAKKAGQIDDEQLKEPPLVFFSGDATPFVQTRATPFMPEGLTDRDIANFSELILSLPVPVVGVPWFQLNHLPAIPVVAHEVGHTVEHDFKIAEPLETLIANLNICPKRHEPWLQWRKEIFADVYACICIGPAFLLALMGYLLGDAQEVQKEERQQGKWGDYPTRSLRIRLNIQTLKRLELFSHGGSPEKLGQFLTALGQVWQTAYPQHGMQQFEDDVDKIISSLINAKFDAFGGVALRDVVQYGPKELVNSWYLSDDILANTSFPIQAKTWSFRVLAAAPTLAFAREPQCYYNSNVRAAVLKSLLVAIPEGTRDADPDTDKALAARKRAVDDEMGRRLTGFFQKRATGAAQE